MSYFYNLILVFGNVIIAALQLLLSNPYVQLALVAFVLKMIASKFD